MWDMLLNDEQVMMADAARNYLSKELPLERLRPQAGSLDLHKVRTGMVELGWFGAGLPEQVGGLGLGLIEEMLVQRECGRFLASPSILATVLGAHVALQSGNKALAMAMTGGKSFAALAVPTIIEKSGDQSTIYAFDWNEGDMLLACTDSGIGLFDSESFTAIQPQDSIDDSITMHEGTLTLNRARHWVGETQAPLVMHAQILLAARLCGLADHACELTVEYAKVREQFGKPIGSFQAVKHRCADMAIRARLSWSLTRFACIKVQEQAEDAPLQAAAAKLLAADAAHENGRAAIQLHGAIGFQSECDANWFMKRAHIYDQAGGAMGYQARRLFTQPNPL